MWVFYYTEYKKYVGNPTFEGFVEQYYPILQRTALFQGISRGEIASLLDCLGAKKRSFEKGATILEEGDPTGQMGIVLEGAVQVLRDDIDGNRSIVEQLTVGALFAEVFACADAAEMPVSVVACGDCTVLLLDCRRALTHCTSACTFHDQLVKNLLKGLAKKTLLLNRKLAILSGRSTREKLLFYLHAEAKRQGSKRIHVPFDRQELADYLGAERSALSAEISKLRKEGILESKKSEFILL